MGLLHSDTPLQLVFRGECLDGHDPQAVRCAVARTLKLDEERASRLFSGKRVVLRRGVGAAAAHRHIARFALMGAVLRAEPATPRPQRAEPVAKKDVPAGRTGAAWRSLSWARFAVLSVVGGLTLGLVLGPGLSTLWPAIHPHGAAAASRGVANLHDLALPAAPAAVAVDVPPTTEPAAAPAARAAADDEIPQDMKPDAVRERTLSYLPTAGHKAFAISSGGAHAWHAGAASENEASEQALAKCMAVRRPSDDGCRVVDLDGAWQE